MKKENPLKNKPKAKTETASSVEKDFPIAGISGSAEHAKTLQDFFAKTPAHSGTAFAVVLHLLEELQSVNEELKNVKHEFKENIDEANRVNSDLQNLMASTEIATIFLDKQLKIKRHTPSVRELFDITPLDVGQPLEHFTHKLNYKNLTLDAEKSLRTLTVIEREITDNKNRSFISRFLPYRTVDDRIDGVVLNFIDITERKVIEDALTKSEKQLQLILESAEDYAIITFDLKGFITRWNIGAQEIFGYTEKEAVGQNWNFLFTPEDQARKIPEKEMQTAIEKGRAQDDRLHVRRDGTRFFISGVTQPLKDNKLEGFVKIARDQTDKLKVQTALREKENLQKLVFAQEGERKRIARDLHDHLGQQLTTLRLRLDKIKNECESRETRDEIEEIEKIAEHLDADVDFLAWELRPASLDDLGLRITLSNFVNQWSKHTKIKTEFHTSGLGKNRLSDETEVNLYRIAQEALNNICKYAEAKNVSVMLEKRNETINLIVEDDGIGFDVENNNTNNTAIGLIGMRERARILGGELQIESRKGKGTTVFARVPAKYTD